MASRIEVPLDLEKTIIPIDVWLTKKGVPYPVAGRVLIHLAIDRALAPKSWRIGRPPEGGYNTLQDKLPSFPLEDVPYSLESVKWALDVLAKPGSGRAFLNDVRTTGNIIRQYEGEPWAFLLRLPLELFQYPTYVDQTKKLEFDNYLANASAPELGTAILLAINVPDRALPDTLLTSVTSQPNAIATLRSVFNLAFFTLRDAEIAPEQSELSKISNCLFSILQIRGAVHLPEENFIELWLDPLRFWRRTPVRQIVQDNLAVLQPYSELVYLFTQKTMNAKTILSDILPQLPPVDLQKVAWLDRQFSDVWASDVWTGRGDKQFINPDSLHSIYAVAGSWYRFEPQLQLYLYPDQAEIIGNFWEKYGESIQVLQDLADAHRDWNKHQNTQNICPNLMGRLGDNENIERLRKPLFELQQTIVVQDVPLRFLFDTQRPVLRNDLPSEEAMLADYDSKLVEPHLRSSLWWFDTLRVWWDVVCKDYLHQKLGEIIQIDSGLEGQEQQINNVVSEALIHYTQKSRPLRKRLNGMKVINSSKLSTWMKQEAKRRFDAILANSEAVSEIQQLDTMVQTGQLPASFARSDLEDLIQRFI